MQSQSKHAVSEPFKPMSVCRSSALTGKKKQKKPKNNYWLLIHTDWLPSPTELDVSGVLGALRNWSGVNEADVCGVKNTEMESEESGW